MYSLLAIISCYDLKFIIQALKNLNSRKIKKEKP